MSIIDQQYFMYGLDKAETFDKSNYQFIDTIRFESQIYSVTQDIHAQLSVDYLSCCLILPNGEQFIFSNNPGGIVIPYYEHDLKRIDNTFTNNFENIPKTGHFFPSELPKKQFGELFENVLHQIYGVTNVVGFHRDFQGYKLITILGRHNHIADLNVTSLWEQELYHYVFKFFHAILPLYAVNKPALKYSMFYQNELFRKRFIAGKLQDIVTQMKERELQCLYWARMGKTAEETAMILNLGKSTVRRYLENVREKFDVSSIPEAIVLAIQQKLIT